MISAFASAAELFDEPRYRQAAIDAVAFVDRELLHDGRLLSTWKDGVAKLNGYLDDYAFFAAALLDLFEAVQDRRYLERAGASDGLRCSRISGTPRRAASSSPATTTRR